MPIDRSPLTPPSVIAEASRLLASNEFRVVHDVGFTRLPRERTLLAEDRYSFVVMVVFESWEQLSSEWEACQGELVEVMNRTLNRSSAKAWDGYLVLACLEEAPNSDAVNSIQRDITRVRKLIGTARSLQTISGVSRLLDPFMPITAAPAHHVGDILSKLSEVLSPEVDGATVRALVEAYRNGEGLLQKLSEIEDLT